MLPFLGYPFYSALNNLKLRGVRKSNYTGTLKFPCNFGGKPKFSWFLGQKMTEFPKYGGMGMRFRVSDT